MTPMILLQRNPSSGRLRIKFNPDNLMPIGAISLFDTLQKSSHTTIIADRTHFEDDGDFDFYLDDSSEQNPRT